MCWDNNYYERDEIVTQIIIKNKYDNMIKGGLFGAVLGDAVGVPVEFSSRSQRKQDPVKEMRAYGTYNQPIGTWSDDSSMLLCLVESITEGFSLEKLADKFVRFAFNAYMTPHDKLFDIGNATLDAVENIRAGADLQECGLKSERDNGNGSLMRILPLAFYTKDMGVEKRIKLIEDVSGLTHAHDRSKLACIIYVQTAIELLNGKSKKAAYLSSIDFVKENLKDRYNKEFSHYKDILNGKIGERSEDSIKSSGYVLDTLEAVLWCFLNEESYNDCIFKAVNLGGDTDTIACISGGLAGIYYGFNSIDSAMIQNLVKLDLLNLLIDDFSQMFC